MRIHGGGRLTSCALSALLAIGLATEARAAVPPAERAALIALYDGTNGAGWSNRSNWRNADDTGFNDVGTECTWYGVTCLGDNVNRLDLQANNLAGPLPPEIASLSELTEAWLYGNQLTGPLPTPIAGLSKLEVLYLSGNQLSGPIPSWLGSVATLKTLELSGNSLSGSIPVELGSLASLESLELSSNQLSGSIPVELANLTSLQHLGLSADQLSGPIPSQLGSLPSLKSLFLMDNQLTGGLPPELGQLANLETAWLGGNPLGGPIPKELGGLAKLGSLLLWDCQLTGPIPPELGGLTSLHTLLLSQNQLSGDIPPSLWNLTSLVTLRLDSNQLTGSIPAAVGNLTHLGELALQNNQLSGSIPPEIGSLANLSWLKLGGNQLTGPIPSQLGNLTSGFFISLGSNQLSGPIPSSLGNLTSVEQLDLSGNHLDGPIPSSLGLSSVVHLSLRANRLSGPIPKELGNLARLQTLNLDGNQLTGAIPPELTNLTNLWALFLDWNGLHNSDPALAAFLTPIAGDWESSQTVAPTGVATSAAGTDSVILSWTPITYTSDGGGYRVRYGTTPGGPYPGVFGPTAGKEVASTTVNGLAPDTPYYFVVETVTDPHFFNENTVVSEASEEVSAHTASGPVTYVLTVTKDGTGSGRVTSSPAGIDCGTDCDETVVGDSVFTLTATADQGSFFAGWSGGCTGTAPTCDVVVESADASVTATFTPPPATSYYTVPPCRAYDTRYASLGGPAPLSAASATNVMLAGSCLVPPGASAVSLNVTVTQPSNLGHLRLYPQGVPRPNVSMLNYAAGQTRANNAIVPLGPTGEITIFVGQAAGTAHVIIDVNGYYVMDVGDRR
jgi:Leucine-rich repeat (LRR) protein